MNEAKKKLAVLFLIAGAFLFFGVVGMVSTVRDLRLGLASLEWPSVQGEVLLATRGRARSMSKNFEYRYTVEGTTHKSARAAFVRVPYVDPIYRKYRSGMTVRVHYDPEDPQRAVVEPGAPVLGVLADAFLSLVMFALGGAVLYFGLRKDPKDRSR